MTPRTYCAASLLVQLALLVSPVHVRAQSFVAVLTGQATAPSTAAQTTAERAPDVPPEIEQWMRLTSGNSTVDPTGTDTLFLLSLTDAERQGAFLFKQRCNACHTSLEARRAAAPGAPLSIGPPLSKKNVEGSEDAVRQRILNGFARMPAFRYGLEASQVDMIVEYLKKKKNP